MELNPRYLKIATEVANHLRLLGIPYELVPVFDGFKIDLEWCGADAIIHSGGYGGTAGLLETMGFPEDGDDVTGWLTVPQVLERILHAWNQLDEDEDD